MARFVLRPKSPRVRPVAVLVSEAKPKLCVASAVVWEGEPDGEDPVELVVEHFTGSTMATVEAALRKWADSRFGADGYEVLEPS
jgi:hypothetical protein